VSSVGSAGLTLAGRLAATVLTAPPASIGTLSVCLVGLLALNPRSSLIGLDQSEICKDSVVFGVEREECSRVTYRACSDQSVEKAQTV